MINQESDSKQNSNSPQTDPENELYQAWLTPEIEELLRQIPGPHKGKKRNTVIRLAFARANHQPLEIIFEQPDTCARSIWYLKWRRDPAIRSAYEAALTRVLDWNDQEMAAIEAHYARLRRRSVAQLAAEAPAALAKVMNDLNQPGSHRISAANALMGWADPKAAEQVRPASPAGSFEQTINMLSGMSEAELDIELYRMEQKRRDLSLHVAEAAGKEDESEPGQG